VRFGVLLGHSIGDRGALRSVRVAEEMTESADDPAVDEHEASFRGHDTFPSDPRPTRARSEPEDERGAAAAAARFTRISLATYKERCVPRL
jgi:hypothetical protein